MPGERSRLLLALAALAVALLFLLPPWSADRRVGNTGKSGNGAVDSRDVAGNTDSAGGAVGTGPRGGIYGQQAKPLTPLKRPDRAKPNWNQPLEFAPAGKEDGTGDAVRPGDAADGTTEPSNGDLRSEDGEAAEEEDGNEAGKRGLNPPAELPSDFLYTPLGQSHTSYLLLPRSGLAPLTHEIQSLILRHQYRPASECAAAKFMSNGWFSGMGHEWHVGGQYLALAMELGRIFLWDSKSGVHYARGPHCEGAPRSWLCYFRPETNCSAWANEGNTIPAANITKTERMVVEGRDFVSTEVADLVRRERPEITVPELKYLWRAQSVAFLIRLNDKTVDAVRRLRMEPNMTAVAGSPGPPESVFPLPRGCISAHVRHGDKGREMPLVAYSAYAAAAERLRWLNPTPFRRVMFLSSEDPKVIEEGASLPEKWTVYYSDIPRENTNGQRQQVLHPMMTVLHLLQLLMALECDAWIGTRGSNWNRLIDELKCVWVAKCGHPYVEVGPDNSFDGYRW
ncbi:hypothetical protein DFJ74DRAFT_671656 [Hyaloraphidium curvatum]|nr:hypothetical protein DFJ74DRAFT_671656 [Hyaloraphidium curvatum]